MKLDNLVRLAGKTISQNMPTILTASAVTGVVATAVFSVKATAKAIRLVEEQRVRDAEMLGVPLKDVDMHPREVFKIVWPQYVPVALTAGASIACILGANTLNLRRASAIMGAYTLSEKAYSEYRNQVKETYSEGEEEAIRDKTSEALVRNAAKNPAVIFTENDSKVLCYEPLSGRYFRSTIENIRKAQNDVNSTIILDLYASLNDFYDHLGLPTTDLGETLGWGLDNMVDIQFSSVLDEEGRPTLAVNHNTSPIPHFYKVN